MIGILRKNSIERGVILFLRKIKIILYNFSELKNNRNRAVNWPRTLSSRCGFLLQVESCFLVSLLEGVNLLYSLNDVAYGQVVYIAKTVPPGLVLPCFLIVAVFVFALCQVGCLRASRALSRFRLERELKSALDFAVWLNFSDLLQLLLLYFGLEKFNSLPSFRQIATAFLLTFHVFIELCYDLHFLARQLRGLPNDLRILCALITVSNVCLAFLHTTRFGLGFAKFFTIDEFSNFVSTSCQNQSALSCLFWFDKFLLVFTFLDLLSIAFILAKMKTMDLSPKLLNPVVYFGPSIPLGTVLLREDENEYPAMMSLELEESRALHSRPGHDYYELAYECCVKNEPKVLREILEKNADDLNVEALLKCAAQWTAADVIDELYPKMPRSQERIDSLPPVAYLGLKNQNAPSTSFKRVLLRFRSYFAEPLGTFECLFINSVFFSDEDGNQLLHLFAVTNRIKPVAMLLELDPSLVKFKNYMGLSALDLVPQENIDMRILLLNCGAVHTIHGVARFVF